ncbi:MAG: glycine cleavage system aminomethyltransferase GcvT [Ancrocorticia sp.]|uniref:glycine cleavage system aminomethyltransferase GcvT n=1 Tax=Ancrocorticia sp. TaxID=2593684 RepID=UPI003F93ACF1
MSGSTVSWASPDRESINGGIMAPLLETALISEHQRLGAKLTDFAGWAMPLRYRSDREEHAAVRERAGIFDLSHMAQIEVEGPGASEALDASFVTQPSTMPIGRARYTLLLAQDGGIIDDLIVYRLGTCSFLIVANAANRLVVRDELAARARASNDGSAVGVTDTTLHRALIAIQGPESAAIVRELLPKAERPILDELGYYRMSEVHMGGPVRLARTGYTGETGYELMMPASAAANVWERARKIGESHGLLPCGLASRDTLRLEAGMALYGHELGRDVSPKDVGLAGLVKDHQFVGRAALAERPQDWDLYGLEGAGRRAARAGCAVNLNGHPIGEITSGVLSPTLGHPVALARLTPGLSEGTAVEVDVRGKTFPMTISHLPFYSRTRH